MGSIERAVKIGGRLTSSGVDGFLNVCIDGLGLARLSAWDVRDGVRGVSLIRVDLADAQPQDLSVWAVYPTRRQVLPKLQVFMGRLQEGLQSWNARSSDRRACMTLGYETPADRWRPTVASIG